MIVDLAEVVVVPADGEQILHAMHADDFISFVAEPGERVRSGDWHGEDHPLSRAGAQGAEGCDRCCPCREAVVNDDRLTPGHGLRTRAREEGTLASRRLKLPRAFMSDVVPISTDFFAADLVEEGRSVRRDRTDRELRLTRSAQLPYDQRREVTVHRLRHLSGDGYAATSDAEHERVSTEGDAAQQGAELFSRINPVTKHLARELPTRHRSSGTA